MGRKLTGNAVFNMSVLADCGSENSSGEVGNCD